MGLSRRQYEARRAALAAMTDAEWMKAMGIIMLPSGTLIALSCKGNPYACVRDGADARSVNMSESDRRTLDEMGYRRPGDQQPPRRMSESSLREARKADAAARALYAAPSDATEYEIADAMEDAADQTE